VSAYASDTDIFKPQNYKDVDGGILDPEEGENYELGLKSEWFDGRLQASAAFFEVRKDNLAVADGGRLTPEGNRAYVAANGTKGWEVELTTISLIPQSSALAAPAGKPMPTSAFIVRRSR
jgi:outer membrane receptor for ferric coprogen and ferric-rhodotorulic acid